MAEWAPREKLLVPTVREGPCSAELEKELLQERLEPQPQAAPEFPAGPALARAEESPAPALPGPEPVQRKVLSQPAEQVAVALARSLRRERVRSAVLSAEARLQGRAEFRAPGQVPAPLWRTV